MRSRLAVLLTLLLAAGCGSSNPNRPTAPAMGLGYLEEIFRIMEANALHRHTINWAGFRATVNARAQTAHDIQRTYPAIITALGLLEDGHSTYRTTGNATLVPAGRIPCGDVPAPTVTPPEGVGYVQAPTFHWTGNSAEYAQGIQDQMRQQDSETLAGWIVDLRFTDGETQWPLLAALGPVNGAGVQGYIVDSDGVATPWEYRDGTAYLGATAMASAPTPYQLRRASPRVAVLINGGAGSAGETAAIAFKRRPDTRFFGTPTCGRSAAIRRFTLSDGADLLLAVGVQSDRTRQTYSGRITPDEMAIDPNDAAARAAAWLRSGR